MEYYEVVFYDPLLNRILRMFRGKTKCAHVRSSKDERTPLECFFLLQVYDPYFYYKITNRYWNNIYEYLLLKRKFKQLAQIKYNKAATSSSNNKTLDNLTVLLLATGMISLKITFLNIFPFNSLYSLYIIDKKKDLKLTAFIKPRYGFIFIG